MVEIYESGVDNGQPPPPPSLTPIELMSLTSSNCFMVLFLSILHALIDLCMCQLQQHHIATNVSTSQHLNMGLVLATEGGLHQTETYTPIRQCVEANGAGGRASNYGKWTNKSAVGQGSNILPNLQAIWFLRTRRNWWYHTSFYVERKRQVKLVERTWWCFKHHTKVPISEKEDDCLGHRCVKENNPEVI